MTDVDGHETAETGTALAMRRAARCLIEFGLLFAHTRRAAEGGKLMMPKLGRRADG